MSIATLRKIRKNLELINLVKPAKTSPYRSTADLIIQQYASREITNFRTALNLVMKLSSKRPEVTAKKFNAYVEANKPAIKEQSKLDFGIDDDDIVAPIESKKKITIRSTPKAKETIKKMVPTKLYNFLLELILKLPQYMRRQTKAESQKAYTLIITRFLLIKTLIKL